MEKKIMQASQQARAAAQKREQEQRRTNPSQQRPGLRQTQEKPVHQEPRRSVSNQDSRRNVSRQDPRMHHQDPFMTRQDLHHDHGPRHSHSSFGSDLLGVIGMGLSAVIDATAQAQEQEAIREERIRQQEYEAKKAEQELLMRIPSVCPHCGAPTTGKIQCEYCDSYLVNSSK